MIRKAKQGSSPWRFVRRALLVMLVGAAIWLVAGIVAVTAISIGSRHRTPEDALAHSRQQMQEGWESAWHATVDLQPAEVTDYTVLQRQDLDEINAVLFIAGWKERMETDVMACIGARLIGEVQDIFGGWHLRHGGSTCGSLPASDKSAGSSWQSWPWEFPKYYYAMHYGISHRAEQVEAELTDGSTVSVETVNGIFGLVIRREAPFQIKAYHYIDANGRTIDSINY